MVSAILDKKYLCLPVGEDHRRAVESGIAYKNKNILESTDKAFGGGREPTEQVPNPVGDQSFRAWVFLRGWVQSERYGWMGGWWAGLGWAGWWLAAGWAGLAGGWWPVNRFRLQINSCKTAYFTRFLEHGST